MSSQHRRVCAPRTRIFFSGSRLPLATLSSMEDHKFFSELFGLSVSLEAEACVYVEVLLVAAIVAEGIQEVRIVELPGVVKEP